MYLYDHIEELSNVTAVMMHSDANFLPSRVVPSAYIRALLGKNVSGSYKQVLGQLTNEVHDSRSFDQLAQLADVLFSTYEETDGVLHVYPDVLLSRGAYETMRERLDEIAINS